MRRMGAACLCLLTINIGGISITNADKPILFGEWGTDSQCRGELLTTQGTVHAAPFRIQEQWLGHRDVWCRLSWVRSGSTADGFVAEAHGLCGEDDLRQYRIDFTLRHDELWLSWNQQVVNGPLARCR